MRLVATLLALACSGDPARAAFDGTFTADRNGVTSRAELTSDGVTLDGRIVVGDQAIHVHGTVEGGRARGRLLVGGTGTPFRAVATAAGFELTLLCSESLSGRTVEEQFDFRRVGEGRGSTSAGAPVARVEGAHTTSARVDLAITGVWRRSESFGDGVVGAAVEEFLALDPRGEFATGPGRFAGGGLGLAFEGAGGEVLRGRWRARGGVLEVRSGGPWVPFARYHLDASRLLMSLGDGSLQVWHRVR